MNGKIEFMAVVHQLITIPAHTFPAPGKNSIFINRKTSIWYHEIFINPNDIAVTLTFWACTIRIVKAE